MDIPKTVEVLLVAVLTSDVLLFLLLCGFLNTSSPLSSFLFVSAEKQRFFSLNFALSLRLFRESLRLSNGKIKLNFDASPMFDINYYINGNGD